MSTQDSTAVKNFVINKIKDVDEKFSSYASVNRKCVVHIAKGHEHKFLIDKSVVELYGLSIGERIKARRVMIGMTQADLGLKAGVTQAMVAILEAGNSLPTLDSVYKLKKALSVDITFFDDYAESE